MKKQETRLLEASRLADALLATTDASEIGSVLGELTPEGLQDLSSSILPSGHTWLHLLAQREKLDALRALMQRRVGTQARNAQGDSPLHVALLHNCLQSAKLFIEEGGANVNEVISRRKGTTLLHLMVACDRPHAIKLLLDHKVDVNSRDCEGRTAFHLAAVYGHSLVAAVLIRHDPCDVNAVDDTGHTALMLAILNDNQELAQQLVDNSRVEVVARDPRDCSGLHMAVSRGQLEVVRTLLRRNSANLHSKERSLGRTPIHLACALVCGPGGEVTSSCLSLRQDWRDANNTGSGSRLSKAARDRQRVSEEERRRTSGLLAMVVRMENVDADLSAGSCSEGFPCSDSSLLSENDTPEGKEVVVNGHPPAGQDQTPPAGQDQTPPAGQDQTPEQSEDRSKIVPAVVKGNSNAKPPVAESPRAGSAKKREPRKQACGKGDSHGRKCSAQHSSTVKARTTDVTASSRRRGRHSISMESPLRTSRTQLSLPPPQKLAAKTERKSSLKRPSTAPAYGPARSTSSVSFREPECTTSTPSPGLDTAHPRGSTVVTVTPFNVDMVRCRMVSLLLEYGADANLMTSFRKSPLHMAAMLGAADVVDVLLPHITNINVLSASNRTALHLAVLSNHLAVVSRLIHAGANPALRDIKGMTALHLAARLGHAAIVSVLLRARADVDSTDFKQMTPLHHACLHNHPHVIHLLISAGAYLAAVDVAGLTPMDYRKDTPPARSNTLQLPTEDVQGMNWDTTAAPLQDTALLQDTAPLQDTTPLQDTAPWQRTASLQDIAPLQQIAPLQGTAPLQDTADLQDTTLVPQTAPLQQTAGPQRRGKRMAVTASGSSTDLPTPTPTLDSQTPEAFSRRNSDKGE